MQSQCSIDTSFSSFWAREANELDVIRHSIIPEHSAGGNSTSIFVEMTACGDRTFPRV